MNTTWIPFRALVEWIVAVACIAAVLSLGSFAIRHLGAMRGVGPVAAVSASEPEFPTITAPSVIVPGSVSVPLLLLGQGVSVEIGETMRSVLGRLSAAEQTAQPTVERSTTGDRITRSYEHSGTRFQLVFEPFEQNADPRLAAIYR